MRIIGKDLMEFMHMSFEGCYQTESQVDTQGEEWALMRELHVRRMTSLAVFSFLFIFLH